MIIETYMIAWNREDTIHMSVNYYKQFGRVILYDNFSEDNTREIAEACGAEIQLFGNRGVLSDQHYLDVKNHCWKGSKADWVIVVDDDEILWHNYLMPQLISAKASGYSMFKPKGYSMFSEDMPKESWLDIKTGIEDDKYSKLCCFNPKRVESINYVYGCHKANPKYVADNGRITNSAYLLHYNAVGGAERMIKRHQLYEPRRQKSPVNMRWGLGKEYGYSPESKRIWFKEQLAKSRILSGDGMPL